MLAFFTLIKSIKMCIKHITLLSRLLMLLGLDSIGKLTVRNAYKYNVPFDMVKS